MTRYKKDLDDLLDEWWVYSPGGWENELSKTILKDWYAVSNNKDIVAYFSKNTALIISTVCNNALYLWCI